MTDMACCSTWKKLCASAAMSSLVQLAMKEHAADIAEREGYAVQQVAAEEVTTPGREAHRDPADDRHQRRDEDQRPGGEALGELGESEEDDASLMPRPAR